MTFYISRCVYYYDLEGADTTVRRQTSRRYGFGDVSAWWHLAMNSLCDPGQHSNMLVLLAQAAMAQRHLI